MRSSPFIVRSSIVLLLAFMVAVFVFSPLNDVFAKRASEYVAKCADAPNRQLCYEHEIPKLMDEGYSMEDTFEVVRIVQDLDPTYPFCHVLGHILSEKETAKDPSRWVEVVHRAPSGICSNGALHGAFQERFRTESLPDAKVEELKPILRDICKKGPEWNPTGLEQGSCTHALGHLTMYITGANVDLSLQVCDEVSYNEGGHDLRQLCYDGVFMQLYQPLEREDFDLIAGKEIVRETRDAFCGQFSWKVRSSCITESWPLYRSSLFEPEGYRGFCEPLRGGEFQHDRCLRNVAYIMTSTFNFDEKKISSVCGALPHDERNICFAYAASRIVQTDARNIARAASFCFMAENYGAGPACFDSLVRDASFTFHPGSRESRALCGALPEPYRDSCHQSL